MKHFMLPLALTVSVLGLSALPAHAQIRRSANAAPTAAANRPGFDLKVFVGPAFEGGNRATTFNRTRTTTVSGASGTAPSQTSTASSSPTVSESASSGDGMGVMFGADGTWWATDRLGLGLGAFGAYLGSSQTNAVAHMSGRPIADFAGSTSGGLTTSTTENAWAYSIVPTGTLGGAPIPAGGYTVAIGATTPGGVGGDTRVTTTYGGFTLPTAQGGAPVAPGAFVLTSGSTTAPNVNYGTPTGGASYTNARSVFMTDITPHGDIVLLDMPAGSLSMFGGFTVPNGSITSSFNAKTTGTNDTATETTTTTTGAGAVYTTTTSFKLNETYSANTSFLAVGPVIGLNGQYVLPNGLRLYSQLGYAPALVGSATGNTLTTRNNQTTVAVAYTTGTAGAGDPAAGTNSYSLSQSIPAQLVATLSGTSTIGSLGLGFGLGGLNLFAEGTARSYNLTGAPFLGPELVYGLKLGLDFGF